jgi:arylsulfatase A-like enzyme
MITRRDFLKLATSTASAALASRLFPFDFRNKLNGNDSANIIIILMDAMSAKNLPLYGYPRHTSPQLERFANHSIVYHAHYSAGNFTTPGTASTLTGMLPWKHRAISHGGLVRPDLALNNPFSLLGDAYTRLGFGQNPWADRLLMQASRDLDISLPPESFSLRIGDPFLGLFKKDRALASIATEDFISSVANQMSGSSFLGYINRTIAWRDYITQNNKIPDYPLGIPVVNDYAIPYLNEDVYRGVLAEILKLETGKQPYIAYFHFYSPHWPYRPRRDFARLFHDNYTPPAKPDHPLGAHESAQSLLIKRAWYDEQVAQVDFEFGQLIEQLNSKGVLEHSYILVTSDHGEMFERGVFGHGQKMLYEPNIRIPLLIHLPGQDKRIDVQIPTTNIDLLPTLLSIAGKKIPALLDGSPLPPFAEAIQPAHPIFSMYSVENSAFLPLSRTAISMRHADFKLIAYFGYGKYDNFYELYNLEDDPEELIDLSGSDKTNLNFMKQELLDHLADANRPYQKPAR